MESTGDSGSKKVFRNFVSRIQGSTDPGSSLTSLGQVWVNFGVAVPSRFTLDAVFTGDYESGLRYGCSQSLFSRNCYIPRFDSYVGSVAVMHALTCVLMTSKATKKERGRISKIRPRHGTRLDETHTAATRHLHLRAVQTRERKPCRQKGGHSTWAGPLVLECVYEKEK